MPHRGPEALTTLHHTADDVPQLCGCTKGPTQPVAPPVHLRMLQIQPSLLSKLAVSPVS